MTLGEVLQLSRIIFSMLDMFQISYKRRLLSSKIVRNDTIEIKPSRDYKEQVIFNQSPFLL